MSTRWLRLGTSANIKTGRAEQLNKEMLRIYEAASLAERLDALAHLVAANLAVPLEDRTDDQFRRRSDDFMQHLCSIMESMRAQRKRELRARSNRSSMRNMK